MRFLWERGPRESHIAMQKYTVNQRLSFVIYSEIFLIARADDLFYALILY